MRKNKAISAKENQFGERQLAISTKSEFLGSENLWVCAWD